MQIEFQKATTQEKEFSFNIEKIYINGLFNKLNNKLIQIHSTMQGMLIINCTRCAKEFHLEIDENINLRVSNGIYKEEDNTLEDDIIESYDEIINFDDIFYGELEIIKNDFHICPNCQNDNKDLEIEL